MQALEIMTRRAQSNWKPGCNDRVAAEYAHNVVEAAIEMLKQYDAVLSKQAEPKKLVEAGEVLRAALYSNPKGVLVP